MKAVPFGLTLSALGLAASTFSLDRAFGTLGLSAPVTPERIRSAFKKLSREYHPDLNPEGKAKYQEIINAYEALLEAAKDGSLDAYHRSPQKGGLDDDDEPLWMRSGFGFGFDHAGFEAGYGHGYN